MTPHSCEDEDEDEDEDELNTDLERCLRICFLISPAMTVLMNDLSTDRDPIFQVNKFDASFHPDEQTQT